MSKIIDISLGIGPDLLTWPGDPGVEILPSSRLSRGDPANVSALRLGSHTGTHVDPPSHFIEDGATVETLSLDVLIGTVLVADFTGIAETIGAEELERLSLSKEITRLLIKTGNSRIWERRPADFPDAYASLTPDGAAWIVENGIRLIGTDFLSIEERGASGHPTHRTLLEAGVVIVEGLDLSRVEPGEYTLVCLPLKIIAGDGAPARAVLIERDA